MQTKKYEIFPEFTDEVGQQVIDKGHSVDDVATQLDITVDVMYSWVSKFNASNAGQSYCLQCLPPSQ
jgi:transposase-like protein